MRISGRTRLFALLGDPVADSLSPRIQNAAFAVLGLDAVYAALRCTREMIPQAMRMLAEAGGGGNVTVPHKAVAAAVVVAGEAIGAVGAPGRMLGPLPDACNTFWGEDGRLVGDNTDVAGIQEGLRGLAAPASEWLIVGTGGSARAALAAAQATGAAVAFRSRTPERQAAMEAEASRWGVGLCIPAVCEVAINATPLGMAPGDPLPVLPGELPRLRFGLDLVYARGGTPWVRTLMAGGVAAQDGREVLVAQGAAALERWFSGCQPPREVMRAAVRAELG